MKSKKGKWIVKMECVVEKEVYVRDCTEKEARDNPFDYAETEEEINQIDWKVKSVKPNE